MYKRILVPLDGSQRAECVLPHVEALGRHRPEKGQRQPTIILLRIVEPNMRKLLLDPTAALRSAPPIDTEKLNKAREQLVAVRDRLKAQGLSVEAHLMQGSVLRGIIGAIDEFEIDLVVFASQGVTGVREALFGSVSSGLLATVHRATLMVVPPHSTAQEPESRSIVVPLDGSAFAERILPHTELVARAYDATITLVRVVNLRFDTEVTVLDKPAADAEPIHADTLFSKLERSHNAHYLREARTYLNRWEKQLSQKGFSVKSMLLHGPVIAAITHAATIADADLVTMTSHGRSGLGRVLYGGVAAGVLQALARPLLIVHPTADD
ncbi:MAG: universal stress protein [Haliangiales bacterium]